MTKSLIYFNLLLATSLSAQNSAPERINWPSGYAPGTSRFYVHNEINIEAPPQKVWELLVRAEEWPKWYKGAKKVAVFNAEDKLLNANNYFTWKTMGLHFTSTIREFEPYSRLSWESKKKSIQGYHAWLIIPTEKGCKLITDESQNGWLTLLERTFQPNKLHRLHQVWLEEIKRLAENKATTD